MAYNKKTWTNRESEYPNRYQMTSQNGNIADVAIVPNNGVVTTEGDRFDAATMNDLENRIEAGFIESAQALADEDTTLKGLVNSEKTRATGQENLLEMAIDTNTNRISDEVSRATGAENQLRTDLNAEIARSTAVDGSQTQAISALTTKVENAESNVETLTSRIASLETSIELETDRAEEEESTLQSNIDSLSATVTNISTSLAAEVTRAQAAEAELEAKATRAYKASGSLYFADLPALAATRIGNVYNIRDAFTTTSDFLEGGGKDYPAGTNVAIISVEDGASVNYFYDVMTGVFSEGFYLEENNITLSTSQPTTVTFTDSNILASSMVDAYTSVDGLDYSSMSITAGSCIIIYPEQETAITVDVKIWVR